MSPLSTPRERIRRAYFDLLGIPPSPADVAAFEANPSAAAWEALIDRLLASPQFGTLGTPLVGYRPLRRNKWL